MRTLPIPTDDDGNPFAALDVFRLCISRVKNPNLRARFKSVEKDIAEAAADFDISADNATLHKIERRDNVANTVTNDEMVKVYTRRMVPAAQPGRPVYNRIIGAPAQGRCPLCDVGVVTTLDHHLLKTKYSALTVVPSNLVPACTWCQGAKDDFFPTTAGEQTLHPYFDNFESEMWLRAEVVEGTPASVVFLVDALPDWDDIKTSRARHHLKRFKLHRLYASNAAEELVNIRHRLSVLSARGGMAAIRAHLSEEAETRRAARLNSWQTATYSAAARSDWFCNGGFALA